MATLQNRASPFPRRLLVRLLLLPLCLMSAGQTLAQEASFFSVRKHPGYAQPERSLELLVRTRGTRRLNHFCVIGYRDASGHEYAWVRWEEGKALILWEAAAEPARPTRLADSRRYLRLDKDVVASEEEVNGSSYLVTREWINGVKRDCESHGDKFVISKQRKR
jgi:hypothetical protein